MKGGATVTGGSAVRVAGSSPDNNSRGCSLTGQGHNYQNQSDLCSPGKSAVICGYGDVGKGCAAAMKQAGSIPLIDEQGN